MNSSLFTRRRLMVFISVLSVIFALWYHFRPYETFIFTIKTHPSPTATVPALVTKIEDGGGIIIQSIDEPVLKIGIVIARFPKPGFTKARTVAVSFRKEVAVEQDSSFRPIQDPADGPATDYALDQITGAVDAVASASGACSQPVRIVALDSGIQQNPQVFPNNRVTFGTSWFPTGPPSTPPVMIPNFTPGPANAWQDEADHGTKVLSASIGATTGVLSRVSGVNIIVDSFKIHRPGASDALTSDIVPAVLIAIQQQFLRQNDGSLRSGGAILTFPYRNFCGRSPALDRMLLRAWENGLIVVAGAGNNNSANEPPLATEADLALTPNPCTGVATFPASPSRIAAEVAGDNTLIFVSGSTAANSRLGNGNWSPQTDIFAPGDNVRVINAAGANVPANGTSMSTGYAAGALSWVIAQRPWITPAEARDWIMNPSATAQNILIPTSTSSIMRPRLNLRNYTLPTTAKMSYAKWRLAHNLPVAKSPDDDFDYDSQVDFAEFALGTNPRGRGDKGLRIEDGHVICPLAFYLNCYSGENPYVLQCSDDLVIWTPITQMLTPLPSLTYENDGIVHQIPTSSLPGQANGKRFCRLVVIVPSLQ